MIRKRAWMASIVGVVVLAAISMAPVARAEIVEDERPPLPLHALEGVGGVLFTYSALLLNPAMEGDVLGAPTAGYAYADMNHRRYLTSFVVTETIGNRLELGYSWMHFNIGDLDKALAGTDGINLHTFSTRVALWHEGDFDMGWLPAATVGVHYKINANIDDINKDNGGVLHNTVGIKDDQGVEYTLYFTKMIPGLPRPVMVNVGGRVGDAAQIGLLGFTRHYTITPEGNVVVLVTDKIALSGEYRMKPHKFTRVGTVIENEDDWWSLCGVYVFNNHLTGTVVYAHMGNLLNHPANDTWAVRFKWEF